HPSSRLRHAAHRRGEARSRLDCGHVDWFRPCWRSGIQRRARPRRGKGRVDLRGRDTNEARREAAGGQMTWRRILAAWLMAGSALAAQQPRPPDPLIDGAAITKVSD